MRSRVLITLMLCGTRSLETASTASSMFRVCTEVSTGSDLSYGAAAALFAANGYERTSVRDVAAAADIDPAMVLRYFGSKDALFTEVTTFNLGLPDLTVIERDKVGKFLARHYLALWDGGGGGLHILLRSAVCNEIAAARMREIFARQVLPAIASVAPDAAATRAALVGSQLLGVGLGRYLLKLPPLVDMPMDQLVARVGRTLQAYIFE